jgi:HAD superfamily hydrolase (TIGR01509 family)
MLADPHPGDAQPTGGQADEDGPALEAVLFDMDGLLVDTEHAWGIAELSVMTWLGHPHWSEAEKSDMLGGPLSRVAAYMSRASGSALPVERIEAQLVATMADLLAHGADHRPGAQALLDDLAAHHVPCALVSSSPRNLVDAVLSSVGGAHFTTTIAGDEVARTKPFPDPYLLACARLGVDPARAVVLEDSPVGVAAAEAAGCLVVAVPFVVPIEPAHRRHVVGSLQDLDTARLRRLLAGAPTRS